MATKVYTPAPAGARETRGATRRWWVLAVASVAQLMVVLDVTVVNIALPSAQRALAFSDADRQWVVTAYALAFGSLLLIGGKLSDLLGRNRTFMAGLGRVRRRLRGGRGGAGLRGPGRLPGPPKARSGRCSHPQRSRSSPRHSPAARPAAARSRSSARSPGSPARSACCSAAC